MNMEQIYLVIAVLAFFFIRICFSYFTRAEEKKQKYGVIKDYEDVCSLRHMPSNSFNPLLQNLRKVSRTNPLNRQRNRMDEWFEHNAEELALDGWCLSYINMYGHLTTSFLANLKNPDKNLDFQRLLISVHKNEVFDAYQANYENLLYSFAKKWELAPEAINVLDEDERFRVAKEVYELGRKFSPK